MGWLALLHNVGMPPGAVASQVADAVGNYAKWIVDSGLASGPARIELLWRVNPARMDDLCNPPESSRAPMSALLQSRGLAAGETEGATFDIPTALISHRQRGYPAP